MKRILSLLLAALLLVSLLPSAAAENELPVFANQTILIATGNLRGNLDLYPLVKALKDSCIAEGADVVLVDVGNFLQGFAAANTDRGLGVYNLMDACGYDVANMGLAEFSYADATTGYPYHGNFHRYYTQKMLQDGTDEITYNVNKDGTVTATLPAKAPATFQTICSRYFDENGWYSFAPSAEVVTASGLKLLFLPDTQDDLHQYLPDGALGDESLTVETDGYDLVVTLSNASVKPEDPAADLVIHAAEYEGPFTSDAGFQLEAWIIDNDTKELRPAEFNLSALSPDAELTAMADALETNAAPVLFDSVLVMEGRDSVNRARETAFGDLVTDALYWYAESFIDGWNKDLPLIAIQNGGNLDNFLYTGEITATDLLRALPFSPMGVGVLELTGAQLLEALEAACQTDACAGFAQVCGLKYTIKRYEPYDAGEAYGKFFRANSINRVTITEVNGQPFDPAATYAVVADNFVLSGNDTYYTCKDARDAGAAYVNNGNGVKTRDIVALYVSQQQGGILGGFNHSYNMPQDRIRNLYEPEQPAFTDVPADAYYADAVAWAVELGVTTGTGATTFSPDKPCTRAQVVTFLWRAAGKPEPTITDNPFTDVPEDSYYITAVLWAVENGVTTGTSATTFSPDSPCTRAQVVTFQHRAAGTPEGTQFTPPFLDVDKNAYYYKAMLWALEFGITNGTSETTFSPDKPCTRAQVVTFLYRAAHPDDFKPDELPVAPEPPQNEPTADELELLALINAARAERGAAPLYFNTDCYHCAEIRCEELPISFSHTRPDGRDCFSVMDDEGITGYHTMGENIQWSSYPVWDPQDIHTAFQNSEGHRENRMNPAFTSAALCIRQIGGITYVVEIFFG